MSVIDLSKERSKRERPDPEHVYVDEHGVEWFKFICEFEHGDSQWGFEIWAVSQSDAEHRMASLQATAAVKGRLFHNIPA